MMSNNNNLHKTPTTNSTTECTNCNSIVDHPCLLHHVRHRGLYRRLCTSCVLKLHPGSFCPTCFELLDPSTPTHLRVSCQKCHSISHSSCIPSSVDGIPYTCPPCSSPSFSFFEIKKSGENGDVKVIDKHAATVLLCAARIAAVSMNKAMGFARSEAERRVREATLSKKRAREALERVASLAAKEKENNGSSSALAQGKEKASKISNGGDVGSIVKHNRIETKAKVSTPIVGSSSVVTPRDKERVKRELKMRYDVKGSSASTMAGETMPMKEEKLENKTILKKCSADVEKGKNGMLPPPTPVEGLVPSKGTTYSRITEAEKGKDGIKSPPNPVEGLLPPKETSYSHNAVVEKGNNGIVLPPNPVVERKLSPKEVVVEVDKPKSGLLPSNPVEEMKLTPPKENNYTQSVEAEKVNKVLSPPTPAEETTANRNVEIEKAKNGSLPPFPAKEDKLPPPVKNIDSNVVEVEMVDKEILPPNPVKDRQLPLQESSVNPNLVLEKARDALLPPRPVEEAKVSPKESSGSDNAEPTKADSVLLPPHPIKEGKVLNTVTTNCDMMEDDTTPK